MSVFCNFTQIIIYTCSSIKPIVSIDRSGSVPIDRCGSVLGDTTKMHEKTVPSVKSRLISSCLYLSHYALTEIQDAVSAV